MITNVEEQYVLNLSIYQYNSGAGDNGTQHFKKRFKTEDEATELQRTLIERLQSGDDCEEFVDDHVWHGFIVEVGKVEKVVITTTSVNDITYRPENK